MLPERESHAHHLGPSAGVGGVGQVTGPNGYDPPVTATTTLSGLEAGVYTVAAQSVSSPGTEYDPSPGTQSVNITDGGGASANVELYPGGVRRVQPSYRRAVPDAKHPDLHRRRAAGEGPGRVPARVRDRHPVEHRGAPGAGAVLPSPALVSTLTSSRPACPCRSSPNEGSLGASWNMPVPGALIQPGLSILAEVDPANSVAETDETDNLFPSAGTPLALDVRTTSTFACVRAGRCRASMVSRATSTTPTRTSYLAATMRMHPLAAYDADLRAPLSTDRARAWTRNSSNAWTHDPERAQSAARRRRQLPILLRRRQARPTRAASPASATSAGSPWPSAGTSPARTRSRRTSGDTTGAGSTRPAAMPPTRI